MPTVQQDKLSTLNTTITFENFNNGTARRVLHNGTDYLKLNQNDTITYYQTDGQEKVSYALASGSVLDLYYDNANNEYYTARYITATGIPYVRIEKVTDQGAHSQTMVEYLNVLPTGVTFNDVKNWAVGIAVDPSKNMFLAYSGTGALYRFSVTSQTLGVATPGSTAGFTVGADLVSGSIYSLNYNDTNSGFISRIAYDSNVSTVLVKSMSTAVTPVGLNRKLFLQIPDWAEHENAGRPYQLFYNSTDNDTLYYIRRHGTTQLNSFKVNSTLGVIASSGSVFTDTSQNYTTADVKEGDLLVINESGYAFNGTYPILNVSSTTQLTLSGSIAAQSNLDYKIFSNAEQLQFNASTNISAFLAVNADDQNLRAGTSDTATVTVQVINAWGDALNGKTATFLITQGDGVVSPPSAVTSGTGSAATQYFVGSTAGVNRVQVTVSD